MDENAQQFSDEQESVESVVLHKLEVDRLHTALSLLTPEERALIQALFFDERKESELAMELGISQPAVYKRKMKVLKKLKLLLRAKLNPNKEPLALITREVPLILRSMTAFTFEIFMKSSKLSCTLSLKSKRKDRKIWI